MADDQSQRPFRSNQARPDASAPGSDPLAELARLIGQTDPFSEFGRHNARQSASRSTASQQPAPIEYAPRPAESVARTPSALSDRDFYAAQDAEPQLPLPEVPPYTPAGYGRQTYGSAPLATGNDLYQVENELPAYQEVPAYQDAADGGYETDPYQRDHQQDPYDDVPPSRRRTGIVVIAGIFALAVVGTAGAFGYRAIFGSSGSSGPPPVIKAETAPSKIVPAAVANKDPNKQITDRVNEGGAGERLVSRQETPVDVNRTAGNGFPPPQAPVQDQPVLGSGVVGAEPKRVRTISIMPDQVGAPAANAMPAPSPTTASTPPRVVNITPARPNSQPSADVDMTRPQAAPRQQAPQPAPPPVQQQAAAPSNAPLSLAPNAAAPRAPAPPARTASAPTQLAPAASGATGGFAVQLSSQRSEAEAQSAFRALQSRFPEQLGNQQVLVRRVDLGDKGIYYRAMVGPFANGSDATGLCSSLKAAGGQCIVQKN
ncbi:MAG: SPOR domain-containing protein [Pseudolabrys sp.]|nr:SPOR domain-containing protein [Pseudolabrys sp.]